MSHLHDGIIPSVVELRRGVTMVKVMGEFIPRETHQTHTGSWSLVNWRVLSLTGYYIRDTWILMRWPDGLDLGIGLGQARCINVIPWHHPAWWVSLFCLRYVLPRLIPQSIKPPQLVPHSNKLSRCLIVTVGRISDD